MQFPRKGRAPADLLAELEALKGHDVLWAEGRVFAYIYDAGPVAMQLQKDAYSAYVVENGLDPTSFPSCFELEKRVIGMALDLQQGGPGAEGNFTSGGTESILLSIKTARDRARELRPHITRPNIVIPETGHSSFFKACAYFDVEAIRVPVDPVTYRAVPAEMEDAIDDQTILMVGSATSYAHGVVDPVEELGEIALRHDILLHVDSCVGGMYLPFAKELGADIPNFNLSVPGVTQLSMDFHKWGYAAKGASSILYKDGDMRRWQIWAWSGWTGYSVINPTVLSTKSGGPVAACWATLQHLGREGYLELVEKCQDASRTIIAAIDDMPALRVLGQPQTNLFSVASDTIDVFALADDMKAKGWYIQPQFGFSNSPANVHLSVGASNAPLVNEFVRDLGECEASLRERGVTGLREMPQEMAALFESGGDGNMLRTLGEATGVDPDNLPERMDTINNLLNQMPSPLRDKLLAEYVNRLYSND
ncbi:MAG: aspartate aminotransferase family protein [Gammaproteobacteria bacterium]|nr:aspartate aminotransferase family protein [Gammaproteobacteria bacterium]